MRKHYFWAWECACGRDDASTACGEDELPTVCDGCGARLIVSKLDVSAEYVHGEEGCDA